MSSKSRSTQYREKLKRKNIEKYQEYLAKQRERAQQNRDDLKAELSKRNPAPWALEKKRKMDLSHAKRQKRYMEKKQKNGAPSNPQISTCKKSSRTRKQTTEQREYWRAAKQKERENMTYQKKMWIKRKDKLRKQELRMNQKKENSIKEKVNYFKTKKTEYNVTAKARAALPQTPEKFAIVVENLITKSTPRKKNAINNIISQRDEKKQANKRLLLGPGMKKIIIKMRENRDKEGKKATQLIAHKLKEVASQRVISKEFHINRRTISRPIRSTVKRKVNYKIKHVHDFYYREDISRTMPSKRFATKIGPGYLLQVPLLSAFKLFKFEHENCCLLGFSKFASLRPKNVKLLNSSHREYCVCVYCMNIRYKVLILNKLMKDGKITDEIKFVNAVLCKKPEGRKFHKLECVNGLCENCKDLKSKLDEIYADIKDFEEVLKWNHWEYKVNQYGKSRRVLCTKNGLVKDLLSELVIDCHPKYGFSFSKHLFVAHWQQCQFTNVKNNLPPNCVLQIIDFAKNRTIRYQDEIKSAFFGAQQVTMFPVVNYLKCKDERIRISIIFMSDDITHDYHAVQHYMKLADNFLCKFIDAKKKIVFSDGCSGQFKSKGPFADLSLEQFKVINRNYYGSEHGKGEGDGEIGVVGRQIERAVIGRQTIMNSAKDMFQWCDINLTVNKGDSQRYFKYVNSGDINRNRPFTAVQSVKGSRSFHQMENIISKPYQLKSRDLSCFCTACFDEPDGNTCLNSDFVTDFTTVILKRNQVEVEVLEDETCVQSSPLDISSSDLAAEFNMEGFDALDIDDILKLCPSSEMKPGQFVLTILSSDQKSNPKEYVAEIKEVNTEMGEVLLHFMEEAGGLYFWPSREDIGWEPFESVKRQLSNPELIENKSTERKQFFKFS